MSGRLLIFGAGGHARELAWIARAAGWRDVLHLAPAGAPRPDPEPDAPVADEQRVLADAPSGAPAVIGVGDNHARAAIARRFGPRLTWPSLAHPSAVLAPDAVLGPGAVLFPTACVSVGCRIGAHAILNVGASVSHDVVVGDCAHVGPGARLAGAVRVGARTLIGAGACARPSRLDAPVVIGADAVVGAGAAVVGSVPDGARVVGAPARPSPPTLPCAPEEERPS